MKDIQPRVQAQGGKAGQGSRSGGGLAPFLWRGIGLGSGHLLELRWACEVERGMAADGVVEAIDVTAGGGCGVGACFEGSAPDELGFQRLKNVSTMALSKQFPRPDMEIRMPWAFSSAW
jgi:hypothetical protein